MNPQLSYRSRKLNVIWNVVILLHELENEIKTTIELSHLFLQCQNFENFEWQQPFFYRKIIFTVKNINDNKKVSLSVVMAT